jgi:hypothetical protein
MYYFSEDIVCCHNRSCSENEKFYRVPTIELIPVEKNENKTKNCDKTMISMGEITEEIRNLMGDKWPIELIFTIVCDQKRYIEILIPDDAYNLPMDEFSKRYLEPMTTCIKNKMELINEKENT